ncbi:MAG: hypothetical protein EHM77_09320, partial [Planctomycetaceae bacterium]
QWASVLPPIPENFGVNHETLFRFLTRPLKPEIQDIYDRAQKKLMEPKSLQEAFHLSQQMTPEEKYNSATTMLEQWNSKYATMHSKDTPHVAPVHAVKLVMNMEKHKLCMEELTRIMDTIYDDIKGTSLYKKLLKNLTEVSKKYLYCIQKPLSSENVHEFNNALTSALDNIGLVEKQAVINHVYQVNKQKFIDNVNKVHPTYLKIVDNQNSAPPLVLYHLQDSAQYMPRVCENSNGLDIPLQETVHFKPYELKKVNLGIKFIFPKNYCALLMNKSSARIKYNVQVQLGLIDVGYSDYVQTVLQNMTNSNISLPAGIAVAQLLLIKSKIPEFSPEWKEPDTLRGSFGSTGQIFEKRAECVKPPSEELRTHETQLNSVQFRARFESSKIHPLLCMEDLLGPSFIALDNVRVSLLGTPESRTQQLFLLKKFENDQVWKETHKITNHLPTLQESPCFHIAGETINSQISAKEQIEIPNDSLQLSQPIDNATLSALLAADLSNNKKLSHESLIY